MSKQTEAEKRWEEAKKDIDRHDREHEKQHGRDWRNPRRTA